MDLHQTLEQLTPLPVVRVNRAVTEAKVFGAGAGLEVLGSVTAMGDRHLYWSGDRAGANRRLVSFMEQSRDRRKASSEQDIPVAEN